MADAAAARVPENGGGFSGAAKRAETEEDRAQNGGRSERSRSEEKTPLGAAAGDGGASPGRAPPKDRPPKKNFQIPRKSKEKKDLFQKLKHGLREFDDLVNILHLSYADSNSKDSFTYNQASLVHNELLEKEFVEKRRELKQDGRTEKELAESYAFLMVDRTLVQSICENGLQVGHSKITALGSPSMGVYLSRHADLLQANPLEPRATGDIIIFKVIRGKMKSIYDHLGAKPLDSTVKNTLDPTPKHECHVLRSPNRISSILTYRAYERTQYYFYEYEYGFDEIRKRPRHVCPYAIVSFSYKDEKIQNSLPQSRSKTSNVDKMTDKTSYTLWKGQLLNRGTLVCHAALKSEVCPLLPCKLPEKLDVEMVMSIEHVTRQIPPRALHKETYLGDKEEFRNGMYYSLYEVVEQISLGSNLEGLLQKLEKEKLVIVKPLIDRGYLLLLSACQMASPYDNNSGRPRILQALFLCRKSRSLAPSIEKNNVNTSGLQESHVVMPDLTRFIQSLHYAYLHSRKDPKSDFNAVVEKYINEYFSKRKELVYSGYIKNLFQYKRSLDDRRQLYPAPKIKSHLDTVLRAYIFDSKAYQISVSKAKKIIEENQKHQQFSPVSDYKATGDESDYTRKARKRNGSKCETVATKRKSDPRDYDEERIKELINLIQCKKKNVDRESDTEDSRNKSGLKRKMDYSAESPPKHMKLSDSSESMCQNEDDKTSESLLTVIADLGGRDTDLRQQNISDPPETDISQVCRLLSEVFTNTDSSSLARIVNKLLAENSSRQPVGCNLISPQIKEETEFPDTACIENTQFKDPTCSVKLESDSLCLPYSSVDVPTSEANTDHVLNFKGTSTGSVSSFDGYSSPCPSTPVEQNSHRQHLNNTGSTEMLWKLIPITGLKSLEESLAYSPPKDASENDPRVLNRQRSSDNFASSAFSDLQKGRLEDGIYTGEEEKFEDQYEHVVDHCSPNKYTISGVIEAVILNEYNLFTNKIQKILQQKNIMYVSGISRPVLSAQESILRLSEYVCIQASESPIQEYIERLSKKLNDVALSSSCCNQRSPLTGSPKPLDDAVGDSVLHLPPEEPVSAANDFDVGEFPETNKIEGSSSIIEHNPPVISVTQKEQNTAKACVEMKLTTDPDVSTADPMPQSDKTRKPSDNTSISAQPALAGFISQLKPEVFDSIFKIIKDVQKNIVKFYIHEEQESTLCKEIKEYLIKLGNTECYPELFLRRRAELDKLLIIIQNEDIASLIHKIPCLVALKRLSCVSFAGVDSLDDVKNHTYNELFVSGGFIVSDESVLNLELVKIDKLDRFLKFLEELSTPDGKWQWKVHCKIHKKLKELGRTNTNATSLLTLLNAYQKKHVVEILSYHQCDSQTRNLPELDCLIRLQAQNIQQRHTVFLTEKSVSTFGTYIDNGILVTTVDEFMHNFKSLVGYHNSITEENSPSPCIDQEGQSVLVENDEKDEEDMSLDSGDEASLIEVCNDISKYDSNLEAFQTETKGSHGTDSKQNPPTGTQRSTEGHILQTEKTSKIAMQPVTPVYSTSSTEGKRTSATEPVPFNNFQLYTRQLSVSHQFSHFNVLTHQTFLGATYPIATTQNQEAGNYFLTAYSRNMNMDQSSSPNNWDVNCDSSRPYSKPN